MDSLQLGSVPSRNIEPPCGAVRAEAATHAFSRHPPPTSPPSQLPTLRSPTPSYPLPPSIAYTYIRIYIYIHDAGLRAGTSRCFNFFHRPGHPLLSLPPSYLLYLFLPPPFTVFRLLYFCLSSLPSCSLILDFLYVYIYTSFSLAGSLHAFFAAFERGGKSKSVDSHYTALISSRRFEEQKSRSAVAPCRVTVAARADTCARCCARTGGPAERRVRSAPDRNPWG